MMNTVKINHKDGGADYLVRIPKFRLSDVMDGASDTVHPAFIVGGKEVDEICISKYQNAVYYGKAYSLPYQKAATEIGFDKAAAACEAKGAGWHLMTNAEWAAVALWCRKNGTLPHGNTDSGRYHADNAEKGMTYDGCDTLTGSGPATWAHDRTEDGIYDLCGNVWEWVAGLRVAKGRVQVIPDNDAANADLTESSKAWTDTGLGYRIEDGRLTLTTYDRITDNYGGCRFKDIKADDRLQEFLTEQAKALGLFPATDTDGGYFWVDNKESERLPFRGGPWSGASYAGVFALSLNHPRSYVSTPFGFRAAFIGNLKSED
jgi:hypothetical protein